MSDEEPQTPGVSFRISREGIFARHIPTALIIAVMAALQGGGCSKQDDVLHKLDDLNTRVARIEGQLAPRIASHGAEGAGGTGALKDD